MATNNTEQFATALQELENGGDLDRFLDVFAEDAELSRPEKREQVDGSSGARSFWEDYLGVFGEIHSEFSRVIDSEVGLLEWVSTGTLSGGQPVSYAGVSILDFDDAGKVTRFSTYYDTDAFTPTTAS